MLNYKTLVGLATVTKQLSCGRTTIYRLIASGHLHRVKIGRRTLFLSSEIDAFIDRIGRVK